MTIQECFDYVDEIKPNAFSNETKTVWLNEVEGMVQTEIFLNAETDVFEYKYTHTENTPISFPDEHTIGLSDKKLLMKFRPGGKIIRFAPGSIYSGNARSEMTIQAINSDGLVMDQTFGTTSTAEVTTELNYYGGDVVLLAEAPHFKLYPEYIMARIDYANGEYDKYQNTMQMFNAFWGEFSRWFARTYNPADRKGRWGVGIL